MSEGGEQRHTHTPLAMVQSFTLAPLSRRCFCESSVTNMTKDFDYVLRQR